MKKVILSLFLTFLTVLLFAQVHVKGYYRKDGTYVQPHVRSSPDGNPYNNYSYPGNTNPYTGKVATGNPETYLYNYYKNGIRSGESGNGKIYLQNAQGTKTGEYLTLFDRFNDIYTYNLYNVNSQYSGYIVVNNDTGYMRVYDKNKILTKEIYKPKVVETEQPETYNPYTAPTAINTTSLPSIPVDSQYEKEYIKDKDGNYTGYYKVLIDLDDVRSKYKIYNNLGEPQGTIMNFSNGEVFLYDILGRLVKHTTPSKNIKSKTKKH